MSSTEIKKQEVIEELGAWFSAPDCKSFYYEEPLETIQKKLQEAKLKKSIGLSFERLELWYSNKFVYHGLVNDNISEQLMSATYSYFVMELTSIMAEYFPDNPPVFDLHKPANYLAKVIIQKWAKQADKILGWILKGLDTKFLKGGENYKIAAWFIISVACKAFNKKLETEKYNYPPDMGSYQPVIDNWDTQDINEVDKMVSKLCDYHLTQASYGDGNNVMDIQFSYTAEFVHAYEILAWLALREMNGLSNPEIYTHPLMQLPVNRLPKTTAPYQPTELYEQVLARVKEDFKA